MLRRLLPAALIVALLSASIPAPALAVSTAAEIQMGASADAGIVQGSVVETDPLLIKWVKSISDKLFAQTARKDIPYNVKILDTSDVNAFSVYGGYMYVNMGLLDFAQSDDELAGVIGHETGHIERRHIITREAKAQGINLLFGIISLFSPFVYRFGQLMQAGLLAKLSRADELQADQYGVLLMSRAGYDPEAMVTFMQHLGQLDKSRPDLLTKYLEDHPEPDKRVSHLMGYAQLDPTKVTTNELLVSAVHDFDTARYSIAALKFQRVLKADPENGAALLDLGQAQLALGQVNKSEQSLTQAAQKGNGPTRDAALSRITSLRQMDRHRILSQPNLAPLRAQLTQAESSLDNAAAQISARRDAGRDQIKNLQDRLQEVSYELPDYSNIEVRPNSRLYVVQKNITSMGRAIENALDHNNTVIRDTGSIERNKEGGVLKESLDVLHELQAPLNQTPVTPDAIALLPSYSRMLSQINLSNSDLIRAVDASRASLAMVDLATGDLDAFLKELQHRRPNRDFGDITSYDYDALVPLMQKASTSLNNAAVAASQAAQLYNMARSRQLESRITMLGLGTSPQRYATLQNALQQRVQNTGIDYISMLHQGLTPGEVVSASIIAADTNSTPAAILAESASTHRSLVDVANNRGMHAQALEIFLGLVYSDYTDDPTRETSSPQTTNTHNV
ncbi:MAG: M48 family metalloprotease [Candidatus Eremiobacteraeota bacterium]|nr:M48 family metalloprotease [Candidatus Eremiobacteraeota bacterium]